MNLPKSIAVLLALSFSCAIAMPGAAQQSPDTTAVATPTTLEITDLAIGTGREVTVGAFAVVHHDGWLFDVEAPQQRGKLFVSWRDKGESLSFVYGYGRALRGVEKGMKGMRVGGKRMIVIPPKLGYDPIKHTPPAGIPPGSALIFEIELLDVVPQGAPDEQ